MKYSPLALRHAMLMLLAAAVVGCAQLGIPTPDTLNSRIAVGISAVTEVRQQTTTLVLAHKITPDDADNVLRQTDNAAAGLAIARSLSGTDTQGADAKLTASLTILTALKQYLTLKGTP